MILLISSDKGSLTMVSGQPKIDIWAGRVDDIFAGPHSKVATIEFENQNDVTQLVNKLESIKPNLPN